jgi:hypothetical protein
MHHISSRQILVGLAVAWLLVLSVECWLLIDGEMTVRAAQRVLEEKRIEAARLAALDPAPTAAQTVRTEAELAATEKELDRLQTEFAAGDGVVARSAETPGAADSSTGVSLDGEGLVRDLHERLRLAGVSVRPDERFGIEVAGRGSVVPVATAWQKRQRLASVGLMRAFLAARPSQLLSVQCTRPRGAMAGGSPTRLVSGDGGSGAGDCFDFDARHSVQAPGVLETVPLRLTFTGRTPALRRFLNRLLADSPLVAISEIAVEPVSTVSLHNRKSAEAEPVVYAVQPDLSQFAVTVEYCEFAAWRAAANRKTPTAVVPAGASARFCGWSDPTPQARGRGWVYEVFTPPTFIRDRSSRALAAVPAEEAMLADPESPPFDLQLLQVRKRPFRLRLVGFAGGSEDLRGIFADATGKTVIGREGDRLTGHRVRLEHLSLDRAGSGNKGTCEPMPMATVSDERTGEEIVLTTRGPTPAGAPLGWFASRKSPASRRALKEGESAVFEGVRYCVDRIEFNPPLAVVTCMPADGARAASHLLIPQVSPEASRGIPALTAAEPHGRDLPMTP